MQTMTTAPVADDDGLRAEDEQDTTDQSDAEIIRPVLVMRRPIPLATAKTHLHRPPRTTRSSGSASPYGTADSTAREARREQRRSGFAQRRGGSRGAEGSRRGAEAAKAS
jgi:hypothetical protein